MSSAVLDRDVDKIVWAAARAMALSDVGAGTDRVVRLYVDDARASLMKALDMAERQKWTLGELRAALTNKTR